VRPPISCCLFLLRKCPPRRLKLDQAAPIDPALKANQEPAASDSEDVAASWPERQTLQCLICGWSCRTTFNNELWTSMWPL